jgi:hypothetical protein
MDINMTKICTECGQLKNFCDYGKHKGGKFGLNSKCKICKSKYTREWLENNPTYLKQYYLQPQNKQNRTEYSLNWAEKNKEKTKEIRKKYEQKPTTKEKNKIKQKQKNKEQPHLYRWRRVLSITLNRLNQSKESTTHELLKYSAVELKEHLDKQGMNWETDHIDHKIPTTWFINITPPHIVNDLRNLQPLNGLKNKQKLNKYSHPVCKEYYDIVLEYILEEKKKFLKIF